MATIAEVFPDYPESRYVRLILKVGTISDAGGYKDGMLVDAAPSDQQLSNRMLEEFAIFEMRADDFLEDVYPNMNVGDNSEACALHYPLQQLANDLGIDSSPNDTVAKWRSNNPTPVVRQRDARFIRGSDFKSSVGYAFLTQAQAPDAA